MCRPTVALLTRRDRGRHTHGQAQTPRTRALASGETPQDLTPTAECGQPHSTDEISTARRSQVIAHVPAAGGPLLPPGPSSPNSPPARKAGRAVGWPHVLFPDPIAVRGQWPLLGHAESVGRRIPTQGSHRPDVRGPHKHPHTAQSLRVPAEPGHAGGGGTHRGPASVAPRGRLPPGHCCWPTAPWLVAPGPAVPPSAGTGTEQRSHPPDGSRVGRGSRGGWGQRQGLTAHAWLACCSAWPAAPSAACTARRMLL